MRRGLFPKPDLKKQTKILNELVIHHDKEDYDQNHLGPTLGAYVIFIISKI